MRAQFQVTLLQQRQRLEQSVLPLFLNINEHGSLKEFESLVDRVIAEFPEHGSNTHFSLVTTSDFNWQFNIFCHVSVR